MRALYTLLVILTVGIASAQTDRSNVVTVTPFSSNGFYFHMQGEANAEVNCFDNVNQGESYDIDYQGQGQDIDLFVDDVRYRVIYNDRATMSNNISRWSILNEIYDADYAIVPNSDLLNCPGGPSWNGAPGDVHWFVREGDLYDGWAYNPYIIPGSGGSLVGAALTNRYTGPANNNRYNPGGDLNIHFENGIGFSNIASLEAEIEGFIAAYEGATNIEWQNPITDHRGWRIGASVDGASSYNITEARRFNPNIDYGSSVIAGQYHVEASWVYYLTSDINDVSDPHLFIPIVTNTYLSYQGRELTEQDRTTLGEEGIQDRIERGIITTLYRVPTPEQVTAAQDTAFGWIQADILRSAIRLSRSN